MVQYAEENKQTNVKQCNGKSCLTDTYIQRQGIRKISVILVQTFDRLKN